MPKKYLLIEVQEREISEPAFFETREAAEEEMRARVKQVMDLTDEDIRDAEIERDERNAEREREAREHPERPAYLTGDASMLCLDDDTYIYDNAASCERYGNNYDWKIFEL